MKELGCQNAAIPGLLASWLWVVLLLATACPGFGDSADTNSYYHTLTSAINPTPLGHRITSPLLVDTNNTAIKLTNRVVDISRLLNHGEFANLRLGMTMDKVVSRWGKPKGIYSNCNGGPRFYYNDLSLVFYSNRLGRVLFPEAITFDVGLSEDSTVDDWKRKMPAPTYVETNQLGTRVRMDYESSKCILRMRFSGGEPLWWPPDVMLPTNKVPELK